MWFVVTGQQILIFVQVECRKPLLAMAILYCRILKERYASLIHSEAEQETNDLSKAFRFCLSQERKRITIMGATGKREDHTIGNVSLLADYMEQAEVSMMTDYGIFVPIREDSMFESYIGQQILFLI